MIIGVGIDLIKVERIEKALKRKNFLEVTFTKDEIACYRGAGEPIDSLAAKFAVKEAVFKALGTGWIKGTDVEVLADTAGKPVVNLYGESLKKSKGLGVNNIQVSKSYYGDYAVGMAIAER